jgi:HSP20 family protein
MVDQAGKRGERIPMRPWHTMNPVDTMRDVVNRMMDTIFEPFHTRDAPAGVRTHAQPFTPSVDIIEEDEDIRIDVEVPGMTPDDLNVVVTRESVVIRGEKKQEQLAGGGVRQSERSYGFFRRAIPLPADVDKDKVQASFKNGVLTVMLPKSKEAVKKVTIRTEQA